MRKAHVVAEPLTEAAVTTALYEHYRATATKAHTVRLSQQAMDELIRDVPSGVTLGDAYIGTPRFEIDEAVPPGQLELEDVLDGPPLPQNVGPRA